MKKASRANQSLYHQFEQFLHAYPIRFHFVRPGHALERRDTKPEDEVGPVTPAFGLVHTVDAVDLFNLLEPS